MTGNLVARGTVALALASLGLGLASCGSGSSSASQDSVALEHAVRRAEVVNQEKLVAAQRAQRGARPANVSFSAANVVHVAGPSVTMCASGTVSCAIGVSVATCPAGKVVIGGGWDGEQNPLIDASVGYNEPSGTNQWEVIMANRTVISASFHAVAVCAG
jgi:hypothetical protein